MIISSFGSSLKSVDVCVEEFYMCGVGEELLLCYTHYFFSPFGPIIGLFYFSLYSIQCLKVLSV